MLSRDTSFKKKKKKDAREVYSSLFSLTGYKSLPVDATVLVKIWGQDNLAVHADVVPEYMPAASW